MGRYDDYIERSGMTHDQFSAVFDMGWRAGCTFCVFMLLLGLIFTVIFI